MDVDKCILYCPINPGFLDGEVLNLQHPTGEKELFKGKGTRVQIHSMG